MGEHSIPNVAVRTMFKRWETEWRTALERWEKQCQGLSEQLHTLQRTGGLVAQLTPAKQARDPGGVRADAQAPAPSGLSPAVADRVDLLRNADGRCSQSIKRIEQTSKRLQQAQHTGSWSADAVVLGVRRDPKLISPVQRHVSRGESVVVIEKHGEWVRVRALAGEIGWVHVGEISPKAPPEIWRGGAGESLRPAGITDEEWEKLYWEIEMDGRSITGGRG